MLFKVNNHFAHVLLVLFAVMVTIFIFVLLRLYKYRVYLNARIYGNLLFAFASFYYGNSELYCSQSAVISNIRLHFEPQYRCKSSFDAVQVHPLGVEIDFYFELCLRLSVYDSSIFSLFSLYSHLWDTEKERYLHSSLHLTSNFWGWEKSIGICEPNSKFECNDVLNRCSSLTFFFFLSLKNDRKSETTEIELLFACRAMTLCIGLLCVHLQKCMSNANHLVLN